MDNLTHSMVGALLGQAGLKQLSGRAMPTLIIAANVPDVDAVAMLLGTEGLAIRRGITHGPLALLLLPPLVVGLVLAWHRWRPATQGPPVSPGALLLLAYVGALSHPVLDWLNSYGIRFFEPFAGRWFYGDTLFIIDVWVWAALIAGFWLSRRLEKRNRSNWRAPAVATLSAIGVYILGNGLITARAEAAGWRALAAGNSAPEMVVANPQPLRFWERRMLWRNEHVHGHGDYKLLDGLRWSSEARPNNLSHPALAAALSRDDVRAFFVWSRMPIVVELDDSAYLTDQRFHANIPDPGTAGRRYGFDPFTVPLDSKARAP